MKREFLLLLCLCAFAAAMIPRERRAVEEEQQRPASTTTTTAVPNICAPITPCGWAFYKPEVKAIVSEIPNTYCECDVDLECQYQVEDKQATTIIKYCRPPGTALDVGQS